MTALIFQSNDEGSREGLGQKNEKSQKGRGRGKKGCSIPRVLHENIDTDQEKEIMKFVIYREEIISRLKQAFYAYKKHEPYSVISVFQDLILLRRISLDVIDNILKWRKRLVKPEPFFIRKQNYLLKMITDTDFLLDMQILKTKFSFEIGDRNTFSMPVYFTHKYTSPEEQKKVLKRIAFAPMYGDVLSKETFKDVETDKGSPFAQLVVGYQRQQEEEEAARQAIKEEIKKKLFREMLDIVVSERKSLVNNDPDLEEEEAEEEDREENQDEGDYLSGNYDEDKSKPNQILEKSKKKMKKLDLPKLIECGYVTEQEIERIKEHIDAEYISLIENRKFTTKTKMPEYLNKRVLSREDKTLASLLCILALPTVAEFDRIKRNTNVLMDEEKRSRDRIKEVMGYNRWQKKPYRPCLEMFNLANNYHEMISDIKNQNEASNTKHNKIPRKIKTPVCGKRQNVIHFNPLDFVPIGDEKCPCRNNIILLGDKDPLALPEPDSFSEGKNQQENDIDVEATSKLDLARQSSRYVRHGTTTLSNEALPKSSSNSKRTRREISSKWVVDPISVEVDGLYYNEDNPDPNEFYLDPFSKRGQERLSPNRSRSRVHSSRGTSRGRSRLSSRGRNGSRNAPRSYSRGRKGTATPENKHSSIDGKIPFHPNKNWINIDTNYGLERNRRGSLLLEFMRKRMEGIEPLDDIRYSCGVKLKGYRKNDLMCQPYYSFKWISNVNEMNKLPEDLEISNHPEIQTMNVASYVVSDNVDIVVRDVKTPWEEKKKLKLGKKIHRKNRKPPNSFLSKFDRLTSKSSDEGSNSLPYLLKMSTDYSSALESGSTIYSETSTNLPHISIDKEDIQYRDKEKQLAQNIKYQKQEKMRQQKERVLALEYEEKCMRAQGIHNLKERFVSEKKQASSNQDSNQSNGPFKSETVQLYLGTNDLSKNKGNDDAKSLEDINSENRILVDNKCTISIEDMISRDKKYHSNKIEINDCDKTQSELTDSEIQNEEESVVSEMSFADSIATLETFDPTHDVIY